MEHFLKWIELFSHKRPPNLWPQEQGCIVEFYLISLAPGVLSLLSYSSHHLMHLNKVVVEVKRKLITPSLPKTNKDKEVCLALNLEQPKQIGHGNKHK